MGDCSLTFLAAVRGKYCFWTTPFAVSCLVTYPAGRCEIYREGYESFLRTKRYALLKELFGARLLVKPIPPYLGRRKAQSARWLLVPELRSDLTYIGDIDFLITRPNICELHGSLMLQSGLCYSNMVRPGRRRLTGLHCVRTRPYFDTLTSRRMRWWSRTNWEDEHLLFKMCQRHFGLPKGRRRPEHGFHLSPNRKPTGLGMTWRLIPRRREGYLRLRSSEAWQRMLPEFPPQFTRKILPVLERVYCDEVGDDTADVCA